MNNPNLERSLKLAQLALQFGRVERITRHEDGVRPETDTDHTVMLGLVACELSSFLDLPLDRGAIAQYALVHDLVEVYAGDVQTLRISPEDRKAKEVREAAATERLFSEFGESWLMYRLEMYEQRADPEARYVRLLDKVLPKLTHLFNGCVAAKPLVSFERFVAEHMAQYGKLADEYAGDAWAKPILRLLQDAMLASEAAWFRSHP